MKPIFTVGEILWIRRDDKLLPIKIIDINITNYNEVIYTFCNARDDALRSTCGGRDNYFEKEATLKKLVI